MADLSAAIQSVLNDPQSMAQLQSIASSLGIGGSEAASVPAVSAAPAVPAAPTAPETPAAAPAISPDQLQSLLGALSAASAPAPAPALPVSAGLPSLSGLPQQTGLGLLGGGSDTAMLGMLMKAAPLLNAAGQEDDATRLLAALRPLLSESRRKRLDEAGRILRLMRLLPLLRQSGMLQNIL